MSAAVRPGAARGVHVRQDDGREQWVCWWEATEPCAACLVLVHGYAEHSGRYAAVASRLAAAGIAVWSTDLRGHGHSSGERASVVDIADLAADARLPLKRARGSWPDRPLFVLGHSMGGLVATRLALDLQSELAGLILSGAALGDPGGIEPLLDLEPLPEIRIGSEMLSRDPAVASAYDADPLNYRLPFRRETLRALTGGARQVRQRWGELALPLLVLHGGDDPIVPPLSSEELYAAAGSADKELGIYGGLRHEILNEPEGPEIADRIAAWILARTR